MLQTISILLENKPGALLRVTGVLSARGYNIESLTVAKTLDPELSRMTIVVDVEDRLRTQVVKQMNKLINVLQAADMTESPAVIREMVLVRVRCTQDSRTTVLKEAEIFHARVVDSSHRRLRHRSHRRSRKARRIHRSDAQLRRNRRRPLRRDRHVARIQKTPAAAPGTGAGRGPGNLTNSDC